MRVSTFLEEKDFRLKDVEYLSPEIKALVVDHYIKVTQGESENIAHIHVQYNGNLSFQCKVIDLYQEHSPKIEWIKNSYVTDTSNDDFDYEDIMPPFGVVELYDCDMECNSDCTKVMLQALYQLTFNFLLEYFNLIVFHSREAANIIDDENMRFKRFTIHDELYYRSTAY
ncbi:hypothetical protein M3629_00465 [Paenibacillus polysaccharolyticus]|uniref:hypothetical protein n=1 Tax=Paenibacillus polysaccharolyticus TaxID=582692 RepID=UPI002041E84D|nr:hypothetical protein [Paenibacillus polysaccharolyticus]MCM3131236.1 hypothetical protein [Paenibacillus polysaccharolyticus]